MSKPKPYTLQPSLATYFLETLSSLGCPYVQDIEESYIGEILLTAGEQRIRLLMWIFGEIHTDVYKIVNSGQVLMSSVMDIGVDKRVQLVTSLGASFGICKPTDLDLVRGQTSCKKQVAFWKKILSCVCYSGKPDLKEAYKEDKELIHDVTEVRHTLLSEVFKDKLEILPPDLQREAVKPLFKKVTMSNFLEIKEDIEIFSENLGIQHEKLTNLEKNMKYIEKNDSVACENISRSLTLTLSDLDQMMTAFEQVYLNNFHIYCNKSSEEFGDLGPTIKIVNKQLKFIIDFFENLGNIHDYHQTIVSCTRELPRTKDKFSKMFSLLSNFSANSLHALEKFSETMSAQKTTTSFMYTSATNTVDLNKESNLKETIMQLSVLK